MHGVRIPDVGEHPGQVTPFGFRKFKNITRAKANRTKRELLIDSNSGKVSPNLRTLPRSYRLCAKAGIFFMNTNNPLVGTNDGCDVVGPSLPLEKLHAHALKGPLFRVACDTPIVVGVLCASVHTVCCSHYPFFDGVHADFEHDAPEPLW